MKKRHKLQNTVLLSFAILAVILILIISIVVGTQYVDKEMENCKNTAYAYTKSAAELIDGDKIARSITEKGKPAISLLANEFGCDIIESDGSLNRKLLASRAFKDKESTAKLNSITCMDKSLFYLVLFKFF